MNDSPLLFDPITEKYDRVNRILSLGLDLTWRKALKKHLPPKQKLSLLDLATGTGDQIFCLPEERIESAVGIDISEPMLELARKKGKGSFLLANAENLPFAKNSFDLITCSFGIRNMKNPLAALEESFRVLRKGGRLLILEFSIPPWPISPVYLFYLRKIVPSLGKMFTGQKHAYKYLQETIESFPPAPTFCRLMSQASFKAISHHPLALGAVTLYVGNK